MLSPAQTLEHVRILRVLQLAQNQCEDAPRPDTDHDTTTRRAGHDGPANGRGAENRAEHDTHGGHGTTARHTHGRDRGRGRGAHRAGAEAGEAETEKGREGRRGAHRREGGQNGRTKPQDAPHGPSRARRHPDPTAAPRGGVYPLSGP